MAEFLRVLAAGRAARTVACYRSGLRRFREWLEYVRVNPETAPTTAIPPDALERFYVDLLARYGPDKRVTARTYTAAAKAFFRLLFRRRIGPADTSWEVAKLGVEEVTGRLYYAARRVSPDLYKVVQAALDRPLPPPPDAWPGRNLLRGTDLRLELLRDRAVLLMLWSSGMRKAELCSMNRDDLDDGRSSQAVILGKGGRERVAFFDAPTLGAARAYLAERGDSYRPLFLQHHPNRAMPALDGENVRMGPQTVGNVVAAYGKLAGIKARPHDFRHAKASLLLNRGAQLSEVQDILGHASPETTKKVYAHYTVSRLREAFDRYSQTVDELAAEVAEAG